MWDRFATDGHLPSDALHLAAPPFRRFETWDGRATPKVRGSVALLRVEPTLLPELPRLCPAFRVRYPGVPLALEPAGDAFEAENGGDFGGSNEQTAGVWIRPPVTPASLREAFARLDRVRIEGWLLDVLKPADSRSMSLISSIGGFLSGHFSGLPLEDWSVARGLLALELPTPHRWKMARRALPAVIELQRSRGRVAEVARSMGYASGRLFRRHCQNLFGEPPSVLRRWVGWEPLLEVFVVPTVKKGQ